MEVLMDAVEIMDGEAVSFVRDGGADSVEVGAAVRKMQFKFTTGTDLVLMSEVQLSGADIADWGKKKKMYGKVLERFVRSGQVEAMDMTRTALLTAKTLMDRLSYLLAARKSFVAKMEKASGLEEEYDERAQTLDASLNGIKQNKENQEKEEKSELAQKQTQAGEEIRNRAVRRGGGDGSFDTTPRKRAKLDFSLGTGAAKLEASVEKQLELDEKRLQLDRERFELAQKQAEDAREQNTKLMELLSALVAKSSDK